MDNLQNLINQFVYNPEDSEINFSLALEYDNLGHYASALSYYLRAAERTDDIDLKYESLLRGAMCYERQGTRKFTVKGMLQQAVTVAPKRPEAYYRLALVSESDQYGDGRWFDSYTTASLGLDLTTDDNKPLRTDVGYPGRFGLLLQKAHTAWHCGLCDDARELHLDLYRNYDLPEYYRNLVVSNLDAIGGLGKDLHYVYDNEKKEKFMWPPVESEFKVNKNCNQDKRAIIVDNFYEDPDAVREFALKQEYDQGGIGRGYIGNRSKEQFFFPGIKEKFEEIIGKKITTWENHYSSGRFQYNPAGEPLVYHCDENRWAAMVFLTPDAPAQCGTSTFRHKQSGVLHNSDPRINEAFNQKTFLDGTPYEKVDTFGNVYNRLVIFDGGCIHAASEYFGSELEDCRLWHMFFFDTE